MNLNLLDVRAARFIVSASTSIEAQAQKSHQDVQFGKSI